MQVKEILENEKIICRLAKLIIAAREKSIDATFMEKNRET